MTPLGSRRCTTGSAKRSNSPTLSSGADGARIGANPTRRAAATERSNLLVAMAPHVSRFVSRLFGIGTDADAVRGSDEGAGRSVPLQGRFRPPARAAAAEERRARRVQGRRRCGCAAPARRPRRCDDLELAVARAGCALLDREKTDQQSDRRSESRALKRWCAARAARSGVSRLGDLPVSRERSTLAPGRGPASRCRRSRRRWSAPTGGCAAATASS